MTRLIAVPRPIRSTRGPQATACLLSSLCILSVVPAVGQKPVPPQAPSVSSSTPLPAPVTIGGSAPVAGSFPAQIGASSLRATLLLKQVAADKTGQNSVEELLKAGVLKPEDLSWAVHHPRLWQPAGAAGMTPFGTAPLGVTQVYDAFLARFDEQVAGAVSWEEPARSTFAQELSRRGDARCVPIFQAMTREWVEKWEAGDKAKINGAVPGLHPLAWFYQGKGEKEKAAQTYERSAEYSVASAWVGSALVEAARLYGDVGQKEKSEVLYERALREGGGWSKGVAMYDRASALMKEGRQDEARKLLIQAAAGQNTEPVKVSLLSLLSRSYYLNGEFGEAYKYSKEAIAQANRVEFLPNKGLEVQLNVANTILRWSEQWERGPTVIEPRELRLIIRNWDKEPVIQRIFVHTFRPTTLEVTVNNPKIQVSLAKQSQDNEYYSQKQILVEIAPYALAMSTDAEVSIHSPHFSDVIQVPLHVEVQSPIRFSSSSVFFGEIKVGETAIYTLTLSAAMPFRIVKVAADNPALGASLKIIKLEQAQQVEAKFTPSEAGQIYCGTLRIETDVQGQEVIEVPYIAWSK
jgi:tetratricopeptide (TPR) repeat protein